MFGPRSVLLKFIECMVRLRDDEKLRGNRTLQRKLMKKPLAEHNREAAEAAVKMWVEVLQCLKTATLIVDELDWVTHPMKSELNFPIGSKSPLDVVEVVKDEKDRGEPEWVGSTVRWEVPLRLWDAIFCQRTQTPPSHRAIA